MIVLSVHWHILYLSSNGFTALNAKCVDWLLFLYFFCTINPMIKMVTQISNKVPATQAIITGNVDDLFPLAGLTGGLVIKAVMVPDVLVALTGILSTVGTAVTVGWTVGSTTVAREAVESKKR